MEPLNCFGVAGSVKLLDWGFTVFTRGKFLQSYRILALSASLLFSASACIAANDSLPKPAPEFKRKLGAAIESRKNGEEASFRVQTKIAVPLSNSPSPAAVVSPLTGGVAAADAYLKGTVAGITRTLPGQVSSARQVPPEQFRAWLERTHPKFAVQTQPSGSVLEIKGVYDNSGKTLKAMGLPFEKIRGSDLIEMPLENVKIIIADCPGRVPREALQRVRDYVARGGFLLSTDWASDNLVEQAFPGYIKADKHKNAQAVYDAEIVKPDLSLFAGTVTNASWKMDIDSHMITVLRPDVRVLAVSKSLAAEDPQGHGVLAVVFPFGRGYVMHMVAHFDNNTLGWRMLADPAPVINIGLRQALAANFVVTALSGTKIPIHP